MKEKVYKGYIKESNTTKEQKNKLYKSKGMTKTLKEKVIIMFNGKMKMVLYVPKLLKHGQRPPKGTAKTVFMELRQILMMMLGTLI